MYCPQCKCEYAGWQGKCPVCQSALLDAKPVVSEVEATSIYYADLVDKVRENGGTLNIEVFATEIEQKRGRAFPYLGRGYAWTKQMKGAFADQSVELITTAVGRDRTSTFPYFGHGFAWEKELQGNVGGNALTLQAEKVAQEKQLAFPYRGYGRAWVVSMSGSCGEELDAELTITEVKKRHQGGFPYFGFGFAWANAGQLTLKLRA